MSLRESKKQKTNAVLRAAMFRIVAHKPESEKLRKKMKKGKLKLNPTNVEIEAGKSYGTSKHHQDILDEIREINNSDSADTEVAQKNQQNLNKKLDKATLDLKQAKASLKEKNAEIELLKGINESLHSHCRELTSALFEHIPQEKREELFEIKPLRSYDNIIQFK